MNASANDAVDLVEELRLRRWARLHHVPVNKRDMDWHPIVLDEMNNRDIEMDEQCLAVPPAAFAPLGELLPNAHAAHRSHGPRFLASPQRSGELYYT